MGGVDGACGMSRLQEVKKYAVKAILPRWDHVPSSHLATVCAFSFSYSVGRAIVGFCEGSNLRPENSRILIVGATGGRDFHWLTGFGYIVDMLDLGHHYWSDCTFIGDACQAETWKQISERYDLIVMCDVLEHLPEDFAALRYAKMVMKDDGYLFLSIPYCHDLEVTHIRSYSESTLKRLLATAGYDITWKVDRPGLFEAFPRLVNLFNYGLAMLMPTPQAGGKALQILLKAEYLINGKTRRIYHWLGRSPQKGLTLAAKLADHNPLQDYAGINKEIFAHHDSRKSS